MSLLQKTQKLQSLEKNYLTTQEVASFLDIENQRTLENTVKKLLDESILIQLEKGKYLIGGKKVTDFEIAQYFYTPSYVSFETALNYHGILSQFPYEITSATTKKRSTKTYQEKAFSFLSIKKDLFLGYAKLGDSLIAIPEKALFDQLYMALKGSRSISNLDEYDLANINKAKFEDFLQLVEDSYKQQIIQKIEKYL